jgi:hypothetical protein
MLKEFSKALDKMILDHGVELEKTAEEETNLSSIQPRSNQYRSKVIGGRQQIKHEEKAPLGSFGSGRVPFPEAEGAAARHTPTWISNAFAGGGHGGSAKIAFIKVKSAAKCQALHKLGVRNPSHRFLAFGPSDELNANTIVGIGVAALRHKYKNASDLKEKLAADPLAQFILKVANPELVGEALRQILGAAAGFAVVPEVLKGSAKLLNTAGIGEVAEGISQGLHAPVDKILTGFPG